MFGSLKKKLQEAVKKVSGNVDKPLEKPLKVWAKGMWVKQELPVQREVLYRNDKDVIIFNIVEKTAQGYRLKHLGVETFTG